MPPWDKKLAGSSLRSCSYPITNSSPKKIWKSLLKWLKMPSLKKSPLYLKFHKVKSPKIKSFNPSKDSSGNAKKSPSPSSSKVKRKSAFLCLSKSKKLLKRLCTRRKSWFSKRLLKFQFSDKKSWKGFRKLRIFKFCLRQFLSYLLKSKSLKTGAGFKSQMIVCFWELIQCWSRIPEKSWMKRKKV